MSFHKKRTRRGIIPGDEGKVRALSKAKSTQLISPQESIWLINDREKPGLVRVTKMVEEEDPALEVGKLLKGKASWESG